MGREKFGETVLKKIKIPTIYSNLIRYLFEKQYLCRVKKMRNILVYFLIGLIFSGSVGISVFAHLCSINGQELSFFTPAEETCKPQVEETESCCHAEAKPKVTKSQVESEKCCTESVSFYKISTENADKILQLKFSPKHINAFLFFPEIFPSIFEKERQIAQKFPDPPSKSGKEKLIAFQVFRI